MFVRMSNVYGKVVEAIVLGEATSAIEWEAEQFITVFNVTVDYDKKKLTIRVMLSCMTAVEGT